MVKVMVFFSILMIIAGASSSMVSTQSKTIKRFKKKEEIYSLSRKIKRSVLDNLICDSMIVGRPASGFVNINRIEDNQNQTVAEAGQSFTQDSLNLKIDTIRFTNISNWSGSYYRGEFIITFQKSDGDYLAPISIPKFVYVVGGTILNCVDSAVYTQTFTGNQIPGSLAASGTVTAITDCPDQEEVAQFATGECSCSGKTYPAQILPMQPNDLSYYSTRKFWFGVTCLNCLGAPTDSMQAQILCKMKESFM